MVFFLLFYNFISFLFCCNDSSLVLQHERVHSRLSGKTLKFHIMQMMKMGIVKSIHGGVSRKLFLCVSMFFFNFIF